MIGAALLSVENIDHLILDNNCRLQRHSLFQPIMSLDCGPGPLSSFDWSLVNSLLVAVAVRSDVTVWDLSKMNPVSKTYLRQVWHFVHKLINNVKIMKLLKV